MDLTVDDYSGPAADRAALIGPTDRSGIFGPTGAGLMLGAGLTPLRWSQFIDVSAATLPSDVCELGDAVGHATAEGIASAIDKAFDDQAITAALDEWLIALARSGPPAGQRIAAVHSALLKVPPTVAELAIAAGLSERTLLRVCLQAFGVAPKNLLRQKRFQRTLERVREVLEKPLGGLIDNGYVDQAHFNREFRQYMGMTPTEHFNSTREIMRQSAVVRRSLNGAGIQGLHPAIRD